MTLTRKREQARRLLRLIALLSSEGPLSSAVLAGRLECQQQDIQRDLRLLREEGHRTWRTDERPARYGLHRPWQAETPSTDPVRALVNHALLRLLHHHAPTPSRVYHEALVGLAAQLPPRLREVSRLTLMPPVGSTPRILETVAAAWCYSEPLSFRYRKPGEALARISVADIVFMEINRTNLDWYVFARRHGEEHVKTFHLSRFEDATRLTGQTSPEIGFDPRSELDGAWGIIGGHQHCEITLRFSPDAAPYVQYRSWPGQIAGVSEADGSYRLCLRAPLDRDHVPVEVMAWIRGWGPRVEVLSPASVRGRWLADAHEMLSRYDLQ